MRSSLQKACIYVHGCKTSPQCIILMMYRLHTGLTKVAKLYKPEVLSHQNRLNGKKKSKSKRPLHMTSQKCSIWHCCKSGLYTAHRVQTPVSQNSRYHTHCKTSKHQIHISVRFFPLMLNSGLERNVEGTSSLNSVGRVTNPQSHS